MKLLRMQSVPWALASISVLALLGILLIPRFMDGNDTPAGGTSSFTAVTAQDGSTETLQRLETAVANRPADFAAHINLAYGYLQRVRETADPALYSLAASVLDKAEKIGAGEPELFAAKSALALARHEFAQALEFANQAVAIDPDQARYHGLVADAQIELGLYPEAIVSLQNMADRRPDFAAFTRIAYARELYGDPEGALEALQAAIEAGSSIPENMAWAFVQMGDRSFELADFNSAGASYARALARMPDYPGALAGQAKLAIVLGEYDAAADLYTRAFEQAPLSEYAISLGDLYAMTGDEAAAERQYALVSALDDLQRANGVDTDVEIALFRADHGIEPAETVALARDAFAQRPSIYAADVLAWALFQAGQTSEAREYSLMATRLGTQNPLLAYRAAVIAQAAGEAAEAKTLLQIALRPGPAFSLRYGADAEERLRSLDAAASRP